MICRKVHDLCTADRAKDVIHGYDIGRQSRPAAILSRRWGKFGSTTNRICHPWTVRSRGGSNKGLVVAAIVLALACWCVSPLVAQPSEVEKLNQRVIELYQAGRYAEAITLAQRALAIREKALGDNHPVVATAQNSLALLYRNERRYADAEPLFKRSLAIREKALGPDHPDVAQSLNNLAGLYDDQGRYADAEPLYKRSLAIREKALGPDHHDV